MNEFASSLPDLDTVLLEVRFVRWLWLINGAHRSEDS